MPAQIRPLLDKGFPQERKAFGCHFDRQKNKLLPKFRYMALEHHKVRRLNLEF